MSAHLNIACGNTPIAGAINHDRTLFSDYVDVAHDLNVFPWPWQDDEFEQITAHSIVEHLDNFIAFFDEAWRILKPEGRISVIVPRYDHINVFIDPTHKRGYVMACFEFLDPDTDWGRKAHMYTQRKWEILSLSETTAEIIAILQVRK